jgi:hypothetical protein
MNNNYAAQIVSNLENKGESKDYIIGFLQATLDQLKHLELKEVNEYLERTVRQSKQTF